jgi:DNA-binding NarL/FixJ family response regulator
MQPYRIMIADDHVLIRESIRKSIETLPAMEVVGEAGDSMELMEHLKNSVADMVLLDISMPGIQGIEALQMIKSRFPDIKILILTMHKSKQHISRALSAGADGYLLKENAFADLVSAIEKIRRGETYISNLVLSQVVEIVRHKGTDSPLELAEPLSGREKEVLMMILEGKSAKDIGELLSISTMTVYNHRINIKKKLGIRKDVDLVKYGIQKGYISANQ